MLFQQEYTINLWKQTTCRKQYALRQEAGAEVSAQTRRVDGKAP